MAISERTPGLAPHRSSAPTSLARAGWRVTARSAVTALSVAAVAALGLMAVGTGPAAAVPVAGGSISGKVTSATAPGVGLTGVCVAAAGATTVYETTATGAGGTYTITGLPTGTYSVQFSTAHGCASPTDANYATQWYEGASVPNSTKAVKVHVVTGNATTTIDAAMLVGGSISGTVTDATTTADLATVCVTATPRAPGGGGFTKPLTWTATTEGNGTYTIGHLSPALTYNVVFTYCGGTGTGFVPQWFNDTASGAPYSTGATAVSVIATEGTEVNAALAPGGSISGKVTTSPADTPLSGICVQAQSAVTHPSTLWISMTATTGTTGDYTIRNLPAGEYGVQFAWGCWNNTGLWASQWWDHATTWTKATGVTVAAGALVTGISAALYKAATISGKVTEAATPTVGISGICVWATNATTGVSNSAWQTATGAGGTYAVKGLPPGSYTLEYLNGCTNTGNWVTQWWEHRTTPFPATTSVSVGAGTTVTGIDVEMAPAGSISGTVTTATTGKSVADACVSAVSATSAPGATFGASAWWATTDTNGTYTLTGLAPGNWYVRFSGGACPTQVFATQWFDGIPPGSTAKPPGGAAKVAVTAGTTATGTDAALADTLGTLTGTPSTATAGSVANTLTFTYKAPAAGVSSADLDLAVPLGWSAPSTTATAPGYTTSTCGTVATSTLTVDDQRHHLVGAPDLHHHLRREDGRRHRGGGPVLAGHGHLRRLPAGHGHLRPAHRHGGRPGPAAPRWDNRPGHADRDHHHRDRADHSDRQHQDDHAGRHSAGRGAAYGDHHHLVHRRHGVLPVPTGTTGYVVGFAFSWVTLTTTTPKATKAITMTVTDPAIKVNDVIYVIEHTKPVKVGTATSPGTVTVTFTTDPVFLVASPTPAPPPPAPTATGYDLVGAGRRGLRLPGPRADRRLLRLAPGLGVVPAEPVVGMVPTVGDRGYFLVASDGGVFSFGNAPFLGSLPGDRVTPAAPITGIVAANTDRGYFLVGEDGGVFAFGSVPYLGSLPGEGVTTDNIVGIASTPSGNGYWLVAWTGTVYAFGQAKHFGTAKGAPTPVSAIAGTPTGGGYWIATEGGSVYAYGNAKSFGTLPALKVTPTLPVIGIVHTTGTQGYWLLGTDGGIFAFGDAHFYGSLPGLTVHVMDIVGAVPN